MADRKARTRMTSEEPQRRSRASHSASHSADSDARAPRRPRIPARSVSRSNGVDAYAARRKKQSHGRILRGALIAFALILVGVGTAAAIYISNVNQSLSADVSDDLRAQLAEPVEPQDPFYMLLLGVDKSEARSESWGSDQSNFRSDTIILARIDAPAQKVTLISIPRDTLVNMGDYGDQKINSAYSFGGAAFMVEVVEDFAGVKIDAYAEIDFEQFTSIVDTIGGVEVTLPVDVVDEKYAHINLEAGTHQLDGETALALVRSRHAYDEYGGGDFYRAANQRMVIGAIIKKVLTLDPVSMLSVVAEMASSLTVYPLSVTDIVSLAQQFQNFDVDTGFYSGQTPTISQYVNEIWYEYPNEAAWREMMERVDAGLPPYSDESQDFTAGVAGSIGVSVDSTDVDDVTSSTDSGSSSSSSDATFTGTVLVLNGTYTAGLAGSTSTELGSAGFTAEAGNASDMDYQTTMVYYNGSARSSALGVAQTLGVDEENVAENTMGYSTDYDVVVVLGADLTD